MAADAKIASGEAIQSNNFKGVTSVKLRELRKPLNIATCWNVGEEYEYALVQKCKEAEGRFDDTHLMKELIASNALAEGCHRPLSRQPFGRRR